MAAVPITSAASSQVCAMLGGVETRSVSPVFVGRAGELTALTEALSRATAGEPQALLVGGEAGVGKTRLLEEFLGEACARGAVVAVGGCVEIGADGLPFAPFSTALRALRRTLPDELAAAAQGQEGELARLLPELGDAAGPEPYNEDSTARLFELTVRLLERIAADRTVVLALEDLHWADTSTRHLLAYLFRTLHRGRLVVVATYRADDIHRRHPLRPLLAELDRLRTVRRIELPRFTRTEVHRQLTGILAAEPAAALVDEVFRRSDGNAFFVEELVVCQEGDCVPGALSESLRDLLLVRVERLSEDAQKVARIVAEGGSTVEYGLLAAVARLPEDDLIEALRAAVNANILLAVPDGEGYRFRHSLVREAVSDDLLPGERSRLNRRYAEALEADPGLVRADERTTRLASYWYHAHDAAKALPVVLRAAVEARKRHAHAEQLRLLERGLELWDDVPEDVRASLRPIDYADAYPACGCPDTTPLRYLDLLAEAAVAARLCGERERALKIVKRALRLLDDESDPAGRSGGEDPQRAAWFWTERSRLMSNLGRGDGWSEIATAQELVRGLPPSAVHAKVLAVAAGWGMLHAPGPESLAAAERAVEYARLVRAEPVELNARLTLGALMVDAGDIGAGLAEMRAVLDRARELCVRNEAGRAYINIPSCLEAVGRSREAVRVAGEGLEFSRECGLRDNEGWVLSNLVESQMSLGHWDEASEGAHRLQRIAYSTKPRGGAHLRRAQLAWLRGEPSVAAEHLSLARDAYGRHDPMMQYLLPLAQVELGVAAAQGRIADVRAGLAAAARDGFPVGAHRYAWPLLLVAATAEAEARGLPAAEEGRPEALALIRAHARRLATPVPVWHAHALFVAAELARAEGRDDADRWAEVVAVLGPLERPYELARARHRWADALLARGGRRDGAAELVREAHLVAAHLGARPLREDLELLAARARLPLGAPRDTAPEPENEGFGLTPREQDVLRLVAAGRTNRQIAEELYISPKTASVHVSNILAKLGVSGRGEAAALAHRLRLLREVPA
ncbi:helix-turn-helix transcriptional regulator [Streptomyces lavendofoliae]|uniref:Helix-turn-helix transcriptional regulator n=1 Tax=Streptomyces lavendofoliae TaxID=67314 RepID=A0A918M4V0_9ACTN|nr:helix-turn-helix transcriptional regulator [Streptomyces lavendofoliae]GGU43944.1 helix-turn-helix transcriptional regulator [Streptomyces lavendofoliae]